MCVHTCSSFNQIYTLLLHIHEFGRFFAGSAVSSCGRECMAQLLLGLWQKLCLRRVCSGLVCTASTGWDGRSSCSCPSVPPVVLPKEGGVAASWGCLCLAWRCWQSCSRLHRLQRLLGGGKYPAQGQENGVEYFLGTSWTLDGVF